jgi:ubiquinone/menaquinone biosynthesis C-methylase UbiE
MSYVLEDEKEFERLEKQSRQDAYNYEKELASFHPKDFGIIFDAGCGSGVVSRHLAKKYPNAKILGSDFSAQRVDQAKAEAKGISNLQFQVEDLTRLGFENASFHASICRYVLEHMNPASRAKAISELFRCLKSGGQLCIVDVDGFLFNLFPQTALMEEIFGKLATEKPFDLHVGRKIPSLLADAGFQNIAYRIEAHSFQGKELTSEIEQMRSRFELSRPFFNEFVGLDKANAFIDDYFACLNTPQAVLFHNMFIVTAQKSAPTLSEVKS